MRCKPALAVVVLSGALAACRQDMHDTPRYEPLEASSFASIPRGTTYGLAPRGRNALFVMATLVGEPCAP